MLFGIYKLGNILDMQGENSLGLRKADHGNSCFCVGLRPLHGFFINRMDRISRMRMSRISGIFKTTVHYHPDEWTTSKQAPRNFVRWKMCFVESERV